jgi:hypothetical protein
MIETSGLDPHEHLACAQRSHFLNADLNHVRTAGTERAGDPAVSNRAHFDHHITKPL